MATTQAAASTIAFTSKLFKLSSWTILRLPEAASQQLPSRGQVMVEGTFNDIPFQTPLEPDGRLSHYFRVEPKLLKAAGAAAGDTVSLEIKVTKSWPEPDVPADWRQALAASPKAHDLWQQVTPMARWEWIRWARATNNAETHQRRVRVGISKLESGKRRPCCWNRNLSTEPEISKNGVLLEPAR
ncbi:MAG TPA: YdeI/OmpD-associated family protein [Candidatus Saccharimonadales bacterium]|nr:YdeI/OmpD-associated family protein [Candidatus Saccharimonadales bacterium]